MSSYSFYGINFYSDAITNLNRYLKKYPADENVMYAHYLLALIYYEQISDEKKDLKPLIDASNKIDFFLKKYPNSDYAIDLSFKKDLIQNQRAAKELFVAKFYVSTQKLNFLEALCGASKQDMLLSLQYSNLSSHLLARNV